MFRGLLISGLGAALVLAGCGRSAVDDKPATTAAPPDTNRQIFQAKGVVVAVQPETKSLDIKHEDIPGLMKAMQMSFAVRDTNVLAGIEPGDPIAFRLIVTESDGWIDQIQKTGPKTNLLPTTGIGRRVRDVEPLNEGDLLPEYSFTNQFGQSFSTTQFKGQALAINFLFTRCPFPTMCPLLAKNFAKTQQKLLALANGPTNWHLLTITIDPDFDTPAVLKNYADAQGCDPGHWTFATGALIDIKAIGDQFTLMFWRDTPEELPTHNLRAAVINAAGRVQKIFIENQWTADELAAEMVKATAVK